MQPEIVEWPWSNNGGTDRPDADAAGCDAADAAVGRWARRAGRDAGRQLLARQSRHGRRVVRAVVAAGAPGLAPRAAPARRPAAAGAIVPGNQPTPSQVCEAKVLVSQRKKEAGAHGAPAQSEAVRSDCRRANADADRAAPMGRGGGGWCCARWGCPLSVLGFDLTRIASLQCKIRHFFLLLLLLLIGIVPLCSSTKERNVQDCFADNERLEAMIMRALSSPAGVPAIRRR